jgi:hypothetical protein
VIVAVLFVDGLVLMLVLVRRMRVMPTRVTPVTRKGSSDWERGRTKRAMRRAVTPQSYREVFPSCWANGTAAETQLAIDELSG